MPPASRRPGAREERPSGSCGYRSARLGSLWTTPPECRIRDATRRGPGAASDHRNGGPVAVAGPSRLATVDSLFDEAGERAAASAAPLAVRMRPRTLDEVIGQRHLTAPGTPFRKLIENDAPMSLVLWGPPGTGKTTLAYVVSQVTKRRFTELSAVTAGVKDVRAAVDAARQQLRHERPPDRAVRRRGAPVLQDAAGRAAACGGEPLGVLHRRDDGEPVVLRGLAAAVAVAAADAAAAGRRRHQDAASSAP